MNLKSKSSNGPITKADLRTAFKRVDSKFENLDRKVGNLDSKFENLDRKVGIVERSLREEIEVVKETTKRIEGKLVQFKDDILATIDPLLLELKTRQEDREIAAHQISELKENVDNHEERIKNLEQSTSTLR